MSYFIRKAVKKIYFNLLTLSIFSYKIKMESVTEYVVIYAFDAVVEKT